jgi:hypothetical protein
MVTSAHLCAFLQPNSVSVIPPPASTYHPPPLWLFPRACLGVCARTGHGARPLEHVRMTANGLSVSSDNAVGRRPRPLSFLVRTGESAGCHDDTGATTAGHTGGDRRSPEAPAGIPINPLPEGENPLRFFPQIGDRRKQVIDGNPLFMLLDI